MNRLMHTLIGLLLASVVVLPARAEVKDSGANGFSVVENVHIAATPDKVYAALVAPSHWWSSAHTFSHDSANLSLDATAGGCWCERLADQGSVQHLVVVYAAPGHALVMRGALGPLQGLGVNGAMTIALKPATDGTDLSLAYNVGGYLKDGLASWAGPVDGVLAEQVLRLKSLVETGTPEPAPKAH
jgi:uncharacterized protein YndB with AHSA1/START domain